MFSEFCINISQTYSYSYKWHTVTVSIDFSTELRQQNLHTVIFSPYLLRRANIVSMHLSLYWSRLCLGKLSEFSDTQRWNLWIYCLQRSHCNETTLQWPGNRYRFDWNNIRQGTGCHLSVHFKQTKPGILQWRHYRWVQSAKCFIYRPISRVKCECIRLHAILATVRQFSYSGICNLCILWKYTTAVFMLMR